MDKITIIRNFSKCAHFYDRYADIQKFAAEKLSEQIKEDNFKRILEIGCGTGNYTHILQKKFREAKLTAVDISEKMIEVARQKLKDRDIEFITADAEEMNLDKGFDLITSNACFQWFSDLEKTLLKYKNLLTDKSIISFSTFGPLTFWELDTSLKRISRDVSLEANKFLSKDKIKNILNKNFKNFKIEEIKLRQIYFNLKELLDKIKYTGIRGNGLSGKIYFSYKLIRALEDTYLDKFREIIATYQIFLCQAMV